MAKIEVHRAIVTRNEDDDEGLKLRGAIFFDAPTLFDGEYELPAMPCFPFASANGAGMFWVPQVGDEIEVQILADDNTDDTTDVELPEPTYLCMLYSDADDADIDDIFKENYTRRMGWKSNSGHYFLFEDTEDIQFFKFFSGKGHTIILDDTKDAANILLKTTLGHILKLDDTKDANQVLIQSVLGHVMLLDDKNKIVKILHQGGGKLEITEDKVTLVDVSGDQIITLEAGKITGLATAEIAWDAPIIKLGTSPVFHATLAENIIVLSDIISVIGNLGIPTGPPIVPMSSKAGTPLDPTALSIFLKGNI